LAVHSRQEQQQGSPLIASNCCRCKISLKRCAFSSFKNHFNCPTRVHAALSLRGRHRVCLQAAPLLCAATNCTAQRRRPWPHSSRLAC
jgi:hypothetical protein